MSKLLNGTKATGKLFLFLLVFTFCSNYIRAQVLKLSDFVLFSGQNGTGTTLIGSSITINGGSVGAIKLVQTTGNANIYANIYSGDKVSITNSNVTQNISAANSSGSTGTVLSVGSSATINGNINVNGNIVIGGGTVSGTVTHPAGTTYSGPVPGGGEVIGTPTLPILPVFPAETTFPAAGSGTITGNQSLSPGSYGSVNYSGNKTLTLNGPGVYVFNSFTWTGNSNKLVFNFKNTTSGNFYIYVYGNADFGKLNASLANGGSAGRIYAEIHGDGLGTSIPGNSFIIANGSSGGGSKWQGIVNATNINAGINIGSGTGSSTLTGSLWSPNHVTVQSGVTVNYAEFNPCIPPGVKAGITVNNIFTPIDTIPLDFTGHTTLTAQSNTSGALFSWQAINGGIISTNPNAATITVEAAGTYIVTAYTNDPSCNSKDTVAVLAKVRNLIGSELLSLYQNYTTSSSSALDTFFVVGNGYVKIDIIAFDGKVQEVTDSVTKPAYGLINIYPNGLSPLTITGDFPIANLIKLNSLGNIINYVRPYYEPVTFGYTSERDTMTGLVKSAGDTTMKTYLVRPGYHINGNGIKIGVLSNGYATILSGTTATLPYQPITDPPNPIPQTFNTNTAAQDVANGDLPGDTTFTWATPSHVVNPNGYLNNVHVLQDFPIRTTDEGRAMLQIVHDVAPGSELYFRTAFFTAGDFADGIQQLKDAGCKVIVDDVTYIAEPFLKDGVVAQAVNNVKSEGVAYFSAAGNFANRSYEKDFTPIDATSIGFPGKMAHNFGGGDMFQKVRLAPGNYTFVLQWTDDFYSIETTSGTLYDVDWYLTKNTDGTGLIGYNRDNTLGDPLEFIPITIPGSSPTDSSDYNILIVNNTPSGNPARIKFIVFRGGIRFMEFNEGTSTIVGQANAEGAITIGATRFNHVPGHPLLPASLTGITKPLIESFSSIGGTLGRQKPDLVGPDGVNTTTHQGQDYPNNALDGYSNFFGTSAAAPHAAAAAALIMQGRKIYLAGHPDSSPDDIKNLFQSTAVDMETPGFDLISGAGLIDADAAMRTFASPTPFEIRLVKEENKIPCQDPFELTIIGQNFSDNSTVYLVEGPGDSTILTPSYISPTKDTIKVTITTCTGNPEVLVYTPPMTEFGDGGFSNSIFFFDAEIKVQAVNAVKKYGQANPVLDTIVTINGKLLQDTTLSLADIGLTGLKVETPATTYSGVGTYLIKVSRNFDPTDPADAEFLRKYNYQFVNGTLTVEKMPLKVTPNDITATYGQYIGNVTFKYEFDPAYPAANSSALADTAKNYHQAILPVNALALVKDFKKTQANGSVLSGADLTGMNTMVTYKALKNSRKFKIDNNLLVPETDPNNINSQYIVDIASESIYDYKTDPTKAKFYTPISGYTGKAMVGEAALVNNNAKAMTTNGNLPLLNGNLAPLLNGNLAPLLNGNLITLLNGSLATLLNGVPTPIANSPQIQMVNGGLVYLLNGNLVPLLNGGLVYLLNGSTITLTDANSYVQLPNSGGTLHLTNGGLAQLLNGTEFLLVNAANVREVNGNLLYLLNGNLVPLLNGTLISLLNGSLATLLNGTLAPLLNGNLVPLLNTSDSLFVNGTLAPLLNANANGTEIPMGNNKTAVILDETDIDPANNNYLGAMFGVNMITGLDVGNQFLVPGVLVNPNFDVTYGLGNVTINDDGCLLTHGPFKNFGSTTVAPTSMWMNMTTKVSGQLNTPGAYLLFKRGSITFNNVSSTPAITNMAIPDGKIIADDAVTAPTTHFDSQKNMWITRVPVGFASTSDIFITGAIINSSTGFVKQNGNTNSVVKGAFYSNVSFADQWGYGIAAYQPQFAYTDIDDEGSVASINGTYRAGTPIPVIQYLVSGGSSGGGNNYTGGTSNYEKFTACPSSGTIVSSRIVSASNATEVTNEALKSLVQIYPNPASNNITVAFVPEQTGLSKIEMYTIHGKKVKEISNGICMSGNHYQKQIDVRELPVGIYLIRVTNGSQVTNQKFILAR